MRIWHTMSQERFLEELRMSAIAQNASRAVIDQLDQIILALDQIILAPTEEEIQKLCQEDYDKGHEDGVREGEESMWQDCENALAHCPAWLGLSEDTQDALLDALKGIKP